MFGLFVLLILLSGLVSIVYYTVKLGISPMPTTLAAQRALLSILPEKIDGLIYELGSGWGHLAFHLARKYPQNRVIGYELSLIPYLYAALMHKLRGPSNLSFKHKDFLHEDLTQAALIVLYLMPQGMRQLAPKISPRTIVASNTFALPNRKPVQEILLNDLFHTHVYLYSEIHYRETEDF